MSIKFMVQGGKHDIVEYAHMVHATQGGNVYIGHGCNLVGLEGCGGVAAHLLSKYPQILEAENKPFVRLAEEKGGGASDYKVQRSKEILKAHGFTYARIEETGLTGVLNIYSQEKPGSGTFDPALFHNGLRRAISGIVSETGVTEIQEFEEPTKATLILPFIGTGIAGGSPEESLIAMRMACRDAPSYATVTVACDIRVILLTWDVPVKPFALGHLPDCGPEDIRDWCAGNEYQLKLVDEYFIDGGM